MKHALFVLMLLVGACSKTTPAGATGATTDLRAHLPADAKGRAPADDKATKNEYVVDVHGAKVKIVWLTWADGPAKYILSVHWEVATPADGVTLLPTVGAMNPTNAGTPEAAIESLPVQIAWTKKNAASTESGTVVARISADGQGATL
ncbi:MAG TPA: hypothetical protein VGM39_14745 [Kofleriaceae bacterium]|jgi:hypothetical protein